MPVSPRALPVAALLCLFVLVAGPARFGLQPGKPDSARGEVSRAGRAGEDPGPWGPLGPGLEAGRPSKRARLPGLPGFRDVVVLPHQDNGALIEAAERGDSSGVYRFAEAIPVKLDPSNAGHWELLADGRERWTLRIQSKGARSLNLAFSSYFMPEGGTLSLRHPESGSQPYRDFTAEDNEAHGELWTPVFGGDDLLVEAVVPGGKRRALQLQLAAVNHGFRGWETIGGKDAKIGGDRSGACNIDVVCTWANIPALGAPLNFYRNQIRSVGAYTVAGIDTCSGALINNTARDGRPFFLTANHCEVRTNNAASVVVYWNFQNGTCRQPNSSASGGVGNGSLDQFNTGSILRARHADSDFCLLELDDPIGASANPFFAGWDRSGNDLTMAAGIHHPAVAEKRISFEFDSTTTTSEGGVGVPGDGRFIRVIDWDWGSTEDGSSGSSLFDQNGRIVGQLYGGFAACGNNESDWYGKIAASWNGGGSASTRLRNWLDPTNSGVVTLDGQGLDEALSVSDASVAEGDSGVVNASVTVTLSSPASDTVTVDYATASSTATAGVDFEAVNGTLTFVSGQTSRTIGIPVHGDTTTEPDEEFFVNLSNATNATIGDGQGVVTILTDEFPPPSITSSLSVTALLSAPFSYQITASNSPTSYALGAGAPGGMTINSETGLISWTPSSLGDRSVQIMASNGTGTDTGTLLISVVSDSLLIALDAPPLSLNSSPFPWFPQTSITHDGVDAAQSANISDHQSSWLEATVTGPANLQFWWKVSSEDEFDFLRFRINGVERSAISGESGWTRRDYNLAEGSHSLVWIYDKDESVSEGADAGYVDQLTVVPQLSGYDAWMAGHPVGGMTGEGDDFDGDAIPNLVEYALGMNPAASDPHLLPVPGLIGSRLALTISKPPGISDLQYSIEVSNDLSPNSWTTEGTTLLTNTASTYAVRETIAGTRRFMRLRVTRIP